MLLLVNTTYEATSMEKVLQEYWLIIEHVMSGKGGLANG